MTTKERLILLIPAFWASIFDIAITIIHQPKDYWIGDLKKANEGNPIGSFFMQHHVSGLFLVSLTWLILIGLLGYFMPRKVSRIFLLFTLIAHSFGASTWLSSRYGFWYSMVFILFNSMLFYFVDDMVKSNSEKGIAR